MQQMWKDRNRVLLKRNLTTVFSLLSLILILLLALFQLSSCDRNVDYTKEIQHVTDYLHQMGQKDEKPADLLEDGSLLAGDSLSDWIAITLERAGSDEAYEEYRETLEAAVESRYETDEKLSRVKATEWHRIALSDLACGGDPTSIGADSDGGSIDLISDGIYNWNQTDDIATQGNNGTIFALITLDAKNYQVPEGSRYTRDVLLTKLMEAQNPDGSFGLTAGETGDVDLTAMALQAMAPYYEAGNKAEKIYSLTQGKASLIKKAVNSALSWLSQEQGEGGMFKSDEDYTSESCAQVIIALCSLGIDPQEDSRFEKDGSDVVDGLLEFRAEDGGYVHLLEDKDREYSDRAMSSQQAGLAFCAMKRFYEDGSRLYDFT